MKLLLDTCTFLWMIDEADRLSPQARNALEDRDNILILNQVSAWEIKIKYQLGKLVLKQPPQTILAAALAEYEIEYQTIQDSAIWHLQKLPLHHGDPFDRLLIAHALLDGMKMVTPDPEIHKYPVAVIA